MLDIPSTLSELCLERCRVFEVNSVDADIVSSKDIVFSVVDEEDVI